MMDFIVQKGKTEELKSRAVSVCIKKSLYYCTCEQQQLLSCLKSYCLRKLVYFFPFGCPMRMWPKNQQKVLPWHNFACIHRHILLSMLFVTNRLTRLCTDLLVHMHCQDECHLLHRKRSVTANVTAIQTADKIENNQQQETYLV